MYTLRKAKEVGGIRTLWRAMRSKNACKTCALGMGGQKGGMVDESGRRFEVCKKSIQAMTADLNGPVHPHLFTDFSVEQLRAWTPRELEAAGRLTQPMYRGPLDTHYRALEWDDAIARIARQLRKTEPDESFFYFSGRSSNEAGFLLQLFARIYGTNNVNNCSYYCHQASGVGLTTVTGSGTATITLDDLDKSDLLILIGANPASNHPRFMKQVVSLRRRGGKVIVINPLRELGLERFAVPSDPVSLFFPSKTSDLYLQPNAGGDIALLTRIAQRIIERGGADRPFIEQHTEGFDAFCASIEAHDANDLRERAGVDEAQIERAVDLMLKSRATIFCWAMGITHHAHGVDNVQAIGNLALLRGMLGREGAGLLPLRGHSNVQGIGSVGVTPQLKDAILDGMQAHFGVQLPTTPGLDTLGCMERAHEERIRFAFCLGGNLYGSNPDAAYAREAFARMGMVVYLSTTLNTGHAWGTGRETIILPVLARDEEAQTTTQESMFNYVRLSDGGPRRHDGPRSEVETIASIASATLDADCGIDWDDLREHHNIRRAIARCVPGYEAIGAIDETKREFQIEGRTFHAPTFPTESGRAQFHAVDVPDNRLSNENEFRLITLRSEGQFNTVVYEDEDLYRRQTRRDVVLMHADDLARLNLRDGDPVTVRSECGELKGYLARPFDLPPGNIAMYYPEANVLVPRRVDQRSRTPAFKSAIVTVEK